MIKSRSHNVVLSSIDEGIADGGNYFHTWSADIRDVVGNYDVAWSKLLIDKVFLLSVKDLKIFVYDNRSSLGENWWIGEPTESAVFNSDFKNNEFTEKKKWSYWLNSPDSEDSKDVRYVDGEGIINSANAFSDNFGVRPALYLNLANSTFSPGGKGTANSPYVVQA